jgi:hypothetical protein
MAWKVGKKLRNARKKVGNKLNPLNWRRKKKGDNKEVEAADIAPHSTHAAEGSVAGSIGMISSNPP